MRQLRLLVLLDEKGNIHKAAEALAMAQPAASSLLKDLEDALGVPLFERLPRGMRATDYGEIMIRQARLALSSMHVANEEVGALRAGYTGHVKIGAIMTAGATLVPAVVAQVKAQHPHLQITIEIDTSDVLLHHLEDGLLDIVVARLFNHHDRSRLHHEAVADEPMCIVARAGHPLARAGTIELASLGDLAWILPPRGSVLRDRFELMFGQHGFVAPRNVVNTTALLAVTSLLQATDMLAVLPIEVARHYAASAMLAILDLRIECRMDAFGIVTHRDRLLSPSARNVLATLRRSAGLADAAPADGQ